MSGREHAGADQPRLLTITHSSGSASSFVEVEASRIEVPRRWAGTQEHICQRARYLSVNISYHHYYCHPRDLLTVTAPHNAVRIVIVATSISTGAHGDDPSCLRYIKNVSY